MKIKLISTGIYRLMENFLNNKILKKIGVITTYGKLLGGQDLL